MIRGVVSSLYVPITLFKNLEVYRMLMSGIYHFLQLSQHFEKNIDKSDLFKSDLDKVTILNPDKLCVKVAFVNGIYGLVFIINEVIGNNRK